MENELITESNADLILNGQQNIGKKWEGKQFNEFKLEFEKLITKFNLTAIITNFSIDYNQDDAIGVSVKDSIEIVDNKVYNNIPEVVSVDPSKVSNIDIH